MNDHLNVYAMSALFACVGKEEIMDLKTDKTMWRR